MIGILKFKLPEEQYDFKTAQRGGVYKGVLWDLDQWLRNKVKHGEGEDTPAERTKAFDDARAELWQLLKDEGITSEELGN